MLATLAAAIALAWPSDARAQPVQQAASTWLVLQVSESARLAQTLDAIRQNARGVPVELIRLAPGAAPGPLRRDSVVIALGPLASEALARHGHEGPAVHCLAPSSGAVGAPAFPAEPPVETQVRWLATLVPAARHLGLLYNPERNAPRATAITQALRSAGYRVTAQPVNQASELPAALDAIVPQVDALYALPDPIVYTVESARGVLLAAFRSRIPVIGPSDAWVKSGALYAVVWDYAEVGAYCAALATRDKAIVAAQAMPRARVVANLRTAATMGIAWPPALVQTFETRHE